MKAGAEQGKPSLGVSASSAGAGHRQGTLCTTPSPSLPASLTTIHTFSQDLCMALERQGANPSSSPVSDPPSLAEWRPKSTSDKGQTPSGRHYKLFTQNSCQLLAVCLMNHGLSRPHIRLLIAWLTPDNTSVTQRRHPHIYKENSPHSDKLQMKNVHVCSEF